MFAPVSLSAPLASKPPLEGGIRSRFEDPSQHWDIHSPLTTPGREEGIGPLSLDYLMDPLALPPSERAPLTGSLNFCS